jgi:hypothetical protein
VPEKADGINHRESETMKPKKYERFARKVVQVDLCG